MWKTNGGNPEGNYQHYTLSTYTTMEHSISQLVVLAESQSFPCSLLRVSLVTLENNDW